MKAQDLKNSILQLAIQGKLVGQREEEGTARELLKKIEAEKQALQKAGRLKKQKVLPAITEDEIPFEIPESWEWVRLGEIVGISSGKGLTSKQMLKGDVPVFGGNGITGYHNIGNVDKETVVIGRVGYYCGSVHITPNKAWVTDNAFITTYPENHIDRDYLVYILRHLNLGRDNNATAQPVVSGKKIYPILFPLAPLKEQKRIVAKIEALMPYIDQYDVAHTEVETLNKKFPEEIKKSILQYAIQGKLVAQRKEDGTAEALYQQIQAEKQKLIKAGKIKKTKDLPEITEDEIPFDIPESWKWVRFQDICAVLTCGYASTPKYVTKEVGMPFLSAKNIKPYKFLPEDHNYISKELYEKLTKTCKPEHEDILLTRVGAGIGEAAIIDCDIPFAIYVSLTLIKLLNYELIDNRYILYWLNSPIGVSTSLKNIFGKGASQGNLNVGNVRNFLLPLPPINEQKRIVNKIEKLLSNTNQLMR